MSAPRRTPLNTRDLKLLHATWSLGWATSHVLAARSSHQPRP
jgi:hypothetical protein